MKDNRSHPKVSYPRTIAIATETEKAVCATNKQKALNIKYQIHF